MMQQMVERISPGRNQALTITPTSPCLQTTTTMMSLTRRMRVSVCLVCLDFPGICNDFNCLYICIIVCITFQPLPLSPAFPLCSYKYTCIHVVWYCNALQMMATEDQDEEATATTETVLCLPCWPEWVETLR